MPTLKERARGCLLGGALGDALGWPVEFMALAEIHKEHGCGGIRQLPSNLSEITDDTQMTLFTAAGLCEALHSGVTPHDIDCITALLHASYLDWLFTQKALPATMADKKLNGELLYIAGLHAQRAAGTTCLSALASGRSGALWRPINDSKGCGGVMRAAPVGLFYARSEYLQSASSELVLVCGAASAALTHGNPSGYLPAGVLALVIWQLCRGASILDACHHALDTCRSQPGHEETVALCRKALELPSGYSYIDNAGLGAGWVGHEALAIAMYSCLQHQDSLEDALILAVNHSGDSDSTGAIAGNILGTLHGTSCLPLDWLVRLELVPVIERCADQLVE